MLALLLSLVLVTANAEARTDGLAEGVLFTTKYRFGNNGGKIDIDVQGCNNFGRIRALKYAVHAGGLRLMGTLVFYADGKSERLAAMNLEEGKEGSWQPLVNSATSCVNKIRLLLGPSPNRKFTELSGIAQREP